MHRFTNLVSYYFGGKKSKPLFAQLYRPKEKPQAPLLQKRPNKPRSVSCGIPQSQRERIKKRTLLSRGRLVILSQDYPISPRYRGLRRCGIPKNGEPCHQGESKTVLRASSALLSDMGLARSRSFLAHGAL